MDVQAKRVGQVMHRRFIALAPEDSLLEAERLMRMARVRFLPVSDDGVLVGGLTHRALIGSLFAGEIGGALGDPLGDGRVAAIMEVSPRHTTPRMRLEEAAALLLEVEGGCLPVVDGEGEEALLVGVLTESDLLRAAFEPRPR